MSGLLAQQAGVLPDLAALEPGPGYAKPAEQQMTAGRLTLGLEQAVEACLESQDVELAPELRDYAAGLQPTVPPAGTPWSQEVVWDTLAIDDKTLEAEVQAYWNQAKRYDGQLEGDRITASQYYQ